MVVSNILSCSLGVKVCSHVGLGWIEGWYLGCRIGPDVGFSFFLAAASFAMMGASRSKNVFSSGDCVWENSHCCWEEEAACLGVPGAGVVGRGVCGFTRACSWARLSWSIGTPSASTAVYDESVRCAGIIGDFGGGDVVIGSGLACWFWGSSMSMRSTHDLELDSSWRTWNRRCMVLGGITSFFACVGSLGCGGLSVCLVWGGEFAIFRSGWYEVRDIR